MNTSICSGSAYPYCIFNDQRSWLEKSLRSHAFKSWQSLLSRWDSLTQIKVMTYIVFQNVNWGTDFFFLWRSKQSPITSLHCDWAQKIKEQILLFVFSFHTFFLSIVKTSQTPVPYGISLWPTIWCHIFLAKIKSFYVCSSVKIILLNFSDVSITLGLLPRCFVKIDLEE